jgi:glycosyltransferase involved in cell wall biosynthesis
VNILVLAPEPPSPPVGGGRLRAYNLLRPLADRHHLHVLCFGHSAADDDEAARVRAWADIDVVPWQKPWVYAAFEEGEDAAAVGKRSRLPFLAAYFESEEMQARVTRALERDTYDVVYVVTSQMGQFLPEGVRVPAVVDLWNLETLVARRAWERTGTEAGRIQWDRTREFEASVMARCAGVLAISDLEAAEVRRLFCHRNVRIIPNGVDMAAFAPSPLTNTPSLVFTGTMNYSPNVEGLLHFMRAIWPRVVEAVPGVTLTIVGQNPPEEIRRLGSGTVRVTGFVPKVGPYLSEARVAVVPLLSGGGIRNKILEALSAARPVVSTSLGAEGLKAANGVHLLMADTPEDFAAATVRLLRDDTLAARLVAAGRRLVEDHYNWSGIAADLEHFLTTLSKDAPPGR